MSIADALVTEFNQEAATTKKTLARVPNKPDYRPHAKSMTLAQLAPHIAQLPEFGLTVLSGPQFEFTMDSYKPLPFESADQLVKVFDQGAAQLSQALSKVSDAAWNENWKLIFQGQTVFSGSRFLAYRQMFLNHLVHHRAQLGVYLRLNDIPVPQTYGPSADEPV